MGIFLLDTDFSRCHSDPNVYAKKVKIHLIILVLYVDDLILIGSDPKLLNHVKTIFTISLASKFCKPRKEFFFPSLSMPMTFYIAFTWNILKHTLLPSNQDSNLTNENINLIKNANEIIITQYTEILPWKPLTGKINIP
jgi:hypothetical protein